MTENTDHKRYMKAALNLAERGLGLTAPNPSVGCVIVKNNHIIGRAVTAPGGRPHAETQALTEAQENAIQSDLYVTLEPCAHHGKTPPCVEAIAAAKVKRVIIAALDPDPRVAGHSIRYLHEQGIEVITGVLKEEAEKQLSGHLNRIINKRPHVTLKLALSSDEKIAAGVGLKTQITGELAQAYTHMLRAKHEAIMIGRGTLQTDNPSLTCRLNGMSHRSPIRIILDSQFSLSLTSEIAKTARSIKTVIYTSEKADELPIRNLERIGLMIKKISPSPHNLKAVLSDMAEQGITRVLVEGGAKLATSLFKADLIDQLVLLQSSEALGASGVSALTEGTLESMLTTQWQKSEPLTLGQDKAHVWHRLKNKADN